MEGKTTFTDGVLYHGDCLEIMPTLPAQSVDMVLTSPPYDNLRTYGHKNILPWDFEGVAQELWRVIKPGGVVVWVVSDATIKGSETGTSFRQALFFKEIGFNLHDTMIWNKGGFSAVSQPMIRYGAVFEYMFVFSKGRVKTANIIKDRPNKKIHPTISSKRQKDGRMVKRLHIPRAIGCRFNVWEMPGCASSKERTGHPAQMSLRLATDHVLSWSTPGDVVLDPFAGSGTTGAACQNTGRQFVLIEREAEYCEIIKKRLETEQSPSLFAAR